MPYNAIDAVIVALLIFGGRNGAQRGFGVVLWTFCGWSLLLGLGATLREPLAAVIANTTGASMTFGYYLAYAVLGTAVAFLVAQMKRWLGTRLLAVAPWGAADPYLGLMAGLVTWACGILFVMVLLNPVPATQVDWNPADSKSENAVSQLNMAVLGTVRRVVLDGSFLGSFVRTRMGPLLIPAG